ncbi:MAG: insulinase family protein, partial [Clostridiales bacterium]
IKNKELYDYYFDYYIKEIPIKIFTLGDFHNLENTVLFDKLKNLERKIDTNTKFKSEMLKKINKEIIYENEFKDISQSILTLGFYTNIESSKEEVFPLILYNTILGGGINSKLFVSVREKMGLTYNIFSFLDIYKGILVINCGIEYFNKDRVIDEIILQMKNIENGIISKNEIEIAKNLLKTDCLYQKDSQTDIMSFFFNQFFSGTDYTIKNYIEKINAVQVEDLIKIANKIVLNTIHYLGIAKK